MKIWIDDSCFGGWIDGTLFVLSLSVFSAQMIFFVYGLFAIDKTLTNTLMIVSMIFGCLYILYWILGFFKEKCRTLQYVFFASDKLVIKLIQGRRFLLDLSDIRSVKALNMNHLMKRMSLFKGDLPGFDIVLKNGKIYHCSPHMEDIQDFRAELLKELKEGGHTVETEAFTGGDTDHLCGELEA